MIRPIHLCLERLTNEEGVQERLKTKQKLNERNGTLFATLIDDAHVHVDTTDGYGKRAVEVRVWEKEKGDQIARGEDAGKEAGLDGTTNESVQDRVRLAETSSRTGEDDHQRRW